jgi:hypothetical protein
MYFLERALESVEMEGENSAAWAKVTRSGTVPVWRMLANGVGRGKTGACGSSMVHRRLLARERVLLRRMVP